jgi:hypothetical protein
MDVLLMDGMNRTRRIAIPDGLREYHVPRQRRFVTSVEATLDNMPLPDIVTFEPSGEYRVSLSASGIAAIEVWKARRS